MEASNHTPGPWLFAPVDPCTVAVVDEEGCSIFDLTVKQNTTAQSALDSNAALVASAPWLLQTLYKVERDLIRLCEDKPELHDSINQSLRSIGMAIDLATGAV